MGESRDSKVLQVWPYMWRKSNSHLQALSALPASTKELNRLMGRDDSLLLPSPSIIWSLILWYRDAVISIALRRSTWARWRCTVRGVKPVPGCQLPGQHDWRIWCYKEIHSNFRHVLPVVIVVSNLHMPDLYSGFHWPNKSGGVITDYLSLSCFSCLNSSADSPPTCSCSAGYTGNGTHCTGMSSKCGQDSRLANICWGYTKTRVLFVI